MTWKRVKQVGSKILKGGEAATRAIANHTPAQEATQEEQIRRPSRFDSRLFPQLKGIWKCLLLSLPVDILLFASGIGPVLSRHNAASTEIVLLVISCLALTSLFRRDVLFGAILVQIVRNRLLFRSGKMAFFLLLAIVLLTTFLDAYLRHQGKGLSAFIIPTIAVLAAIIPAWKALEERLHRLQRKARNRLIWIEELDKQHFSFLALSLVPARLISLVSACTVQDPAFFWATWISSLFLLFYLEPKESDFVILCRRCLKKTSRSLAGMRYCPGCSRIRFYAPEEMPAPSMGKSR